MSRWLPKKERDKRDKKVVELYQQGVSQQNIHLRFGEVDITSILRKYGLQVKNPQVKKDEK